jgi:hypothetical protein
MSTGERYCILESLNHFKSKALIKLFKVDITFKKKTNLMQQNSAQNEEKY